MPLKVRVHLEGWIRAAVLLRMDPYKATVRLTKTGEVLEDIDARLVEILCYEAPTVFKHSSSARYVCVCVCVCTVA